jgi:hypothetical protein
VTVWQFELTIWHFLTMMFAGLWIWSSIQRYRISNRMVGVAQYLSDSFSNYSKQVDQLIDVDVRRAIKNCECESVDDIISGFPRGNRRWEHHMHQAAKMMGVMGIGFFTLQRLHDWEESVFKTNGFYPDFYGHDLEDDDDFFQWEWEDDSEDGVVKE